MTSGTRQLLNITQAVGDETVSMKIAPNISDRKMTFVIWNVKCCPERATLLMLRMLRLLYALKAN